MLSSKDVISKSYSPFGEPIVEAISGFGYNGEYYSTATGMVYLRARFYEPEMNRFSQKDVVRGSIIQPGSLNRYRLRPEQPGKLQRPQRPELEERCGTAQKPACPNAASAVKNTSNQCLEQCTIGDLL